MKSIISFFKKIFSKKEDRKIVIKDFIETDFGKNEKNFCETVKKEKSKRGRKPKNENTEIKENKSTTKKIKNNKN
jgi:hypothetical protein